MVADSVIRTGDLLKVTFDPLIAPKSTLVVPELMTPQPLLGSGKDVLVDGRPVCLKGDEYPPVARPFTFLHYTVTALPNPYLGGVGWLRLAPGPSNTTAHTTADGLPVLIRGTAFTAAFDVFRPAFQAQPSGSPVPDTTRSYSGTAEFLRGSDTVKAG
ncbi:hypothetical protein [Streptomyces cinnamoneus]|uniref:Uncharacterized protein n=1 Tax=Streptomyces cinnamoneus TaxID=53446 RepID=A0A918TDC3_STRCJ|nr:hypothetical protein [Streptomyces cinnamoneus]GHC44312.1 hypothetical protein GCM10010507_19110 [Streptomyces cinnamoneus]